jgi:hypothetical protein
MMWLTWRQFRGSAAVILGALMVAAAALAVTGPHLADILKVSDAEFFTQVSKDNLRTAVYFVGWAAGYLVPAIIGAFWGAPMIAREIEAGTHRLVWNQSITRTRWLAAKLGVASLCAALAGSIGLVMTWWSGPIDEAVGLGYGDGEMLGTPRLWPEIFGSRGIVPIAMALLALAIGVAAGLLIRRTVAAMAVTFVAVAAVQILMPILVQDRLIGAETTTVTITSDNLRGLWMSGEPGAGDPRVEGIEVAVDKPGAWVTVNQTVDAQGESMKYLPAYAEDCAETPNSEPAVIEACFTRLADEGFRQEIAYHPASQFWALQWREAGLLLALAFGLAGFSFWRIRRDLT